MIAHVAQAGEQRGRVVLQVSSPQPSAMALAAAIRVARAFNSELESLFIEDAQLFDCAAYGFVREVSISGRSTKPYSAGDIAQSLQLAAQSAHRQLEALAKLAEVPLRTRVVRDQPLAALCAACAEVGPWNVVALSEPFGGTSTQHLRQLFAEVEGTTALVLVGPRTHRVTGPAVVVAEEPERLSDLVRAAERLSAIDNQPIIVLLAATGAEQLAAMDHAARLALASRDKIRIEHIIVDRGLPAVAAETLRRLNAGFVICQFGGLVVPEDGDLNALAVALECPLFLVR